MHAGKAGRHDEPGQEGEQGLCVARCGRRPAGLCIPVCRMTLVSLPSTGWGWESTALLGQQAGSSEMVPGAGVGRFLGRCELSMGQARGAGGGGAGLAILPTAQPGHLSCHSAPPLGVG